MKIHRHLLALAAVLMTALSLCAHSLDDLTRQQAREGFIRSLGTADIPVEIESGGYFKSAKLKVNGNWLDVIYIHNADAGYYDDPALMQIYKEVLNEEKNQFISDMASDAFLRNYSDIMSNASEFLGVDGLKVKIMASDGEAYLMFPVTWDDMARLRQN